MKIAFNYFDGPNIFNVPGIGDHVVEVMMINGLLNLPGEHEILVNGGCLQGNNSGYTENLYYKLAFHPRVTLTETTFRRFDASDLINPKPIRDPVADIFFCSSSRLPSGNLDNSETLHPDIDRSTLRLLPVVAPFTPPGQISPQEKTTGYRHVMDAFAWTIRQTFPQYEIPKPSLDWFADFRRNSHYAAFNENKNYEIIKTITPPNPYYPPFEPGQDYIVIQTGTGHPEKTPEPKLCNRLAQALIDQGENVIFLGSKPGYLSSSIRGAAAFNSIHEAYLRRARNLVGRTDLAQSLGLVQGAKAYFGGDTGLTHFASASGIPTISLFGGFTDHTIMGPYWHQRFAIQVKSIPPTCSHNTLIKKYHQAMARLTP